MPVITEVHSHILTTQRKKPGKDPTDPGAYRPISLLKTPGKILEKLISARICVYVCGNNLISKNQYGFRPGLPPDHALKEFDNFIRTYKNTGKFAVAVSFDVAKAFDIIPTKK